MAALNLRVQVGPAEGGPQHPGRGKADVEHPAAVEAFQSALDGTLREER